MEPTTEVADSVDVTSDLLARAARAAGEYRVSLSERPVGAAVSREPAVRGFDLPLPAEPMSPEVVLDELVAAAEPALTATAGPRYFGFVIGGSLPVAVAADVLTSGWDQCGFNAVLSPAAAAAEQVAGGWLKELLGVPAQASVGFVTGAQAANTVGLAAARLQVLSAVGWEVGRDGLMGAPRVRVVASEERHGTIDRTMRLLGFGTACLEQVRATPAGAIDIEDLARVLDSGEPGPLIVCLQAGNVNTGACDDLRAACELVHARGGWVHVDGAFGLWAAANPATRDQVDGVELADSWGCDGHKWLNVPYDCGFAFVARPEIHAAALSYSASYLSGSEAISYGPGDLVLESSRRARGFTVWAALRQLGRSGVADLVERCCALARRFADGLAAGGLEIVNDVNLNQVLVGFGDETWDAARVNAVIAAIQQDGTCWMGGTTWRGRRLMRIAVSNHATTEADVDRSVEAVLRLARLG